MSLKLDSQNCCRISNSHHDQKIYVFFFEIFFQSPCSKRLPKKLFSIKISQCITTMVYLTKNGERKRQKITVCNALNAKTVKAAGLKIFCEYTHNHQEVLKKNGRSLFTLGPEIWRF
jgi:hypothetical protein